MRSLRSHTPDERGRGSAADAIGLVRALCVVVPHEAVEGPLQSRAVGEVAAPEGHPPELLENRTLQPFDETVRPGMARFSAGVPETELTTGGIKGSLELRATGLALLAPAGDRERSPHPTTSTLLGNGG